MYKYSSNLLEKNQIGLFSTKYLTRCILEKIIIYLTVICTTPNKVKEIRTLHMKGHASLKIPQNVVHATGFY